MRPGESRVFLFCTGPSGRNKPRPGATLDGYPRACGGTSLYGQFFEKPPLVTKAAPLFQKPLRRLTDRWLCSKLPAYVWGWFGDGNHSQGYLSP